MRKYKGFDITELADVLGVREELNDADDPADVAVIQGALVLVMAQIGPWAALDDNKRAKTEKKIRHARAFVAALYEESEKHDFYHPVWKGLLEVEDDYSFLRMLHLLATTAWT
jgi:hypothetical protein